MRRTVPGRSCPAALAVLAGCVLAGCGGAGAPGTGTGAPADPALNVARCIRAHGVPHFPDPPPGAGLVIPNSINTNAPAFQSARRACDKLLPAGRPGGKPSESARLAMLAVARCIRGHGLSHFPDPTSGPPSAAPQRGAVAIGRGGMFLVVSDPRAPAFRRAAAACHFAFPHAGGG